MLQYTMFGNSEKKIIGEAKLITDNLYPKKKSAKAMLLLFQKLVAEKYKDFPKIVIRWAIDGKNMKQMSNWLDDKGGYEYLEKVIRYNIDNWDDLKSKIGCKDKVPTIGTFVYKRERIVMEYEKSLNVTNLNRVSKEKGSKMFDW